MGHLTKSNFTIFFSLDLMHSIEKRIQAAYYYGKCKSLRKASLHYKIGKSTLQRWMSTNQSISRKIRSKKVTISIFTLIELSLRKAPFLKLIDLQKILIRSLKTKLSLETIRKSIKTIGFTRKTSQAIVVKSFAHFNLLQDLRNSFIDNISKLDINSVISIDEAAIHHNQIPLKGYSKKGTRVQVPVPSIRAAKYSLLMAISTKKIEQIEIHKGSINTELFISFISKLTHHIPPSTFLMDNVAFHRNKNVIKAIEKEGHLVLYTPPYSPQFNPIENIFGIIKTHIRNKYGEPFESILDYVSNFEVHSDVLLNTFHSAFSVRLEDFSNPFL